MSRFRVSQEIEINDKSGKPMMVQKLAVIDLEKEGEEIKFIDYRPVVQEILRIGLRVFRENCVNAVYQHFGNQVATAEALGMQRTYISRIMSERRQRIKEEKNEENLIGLSGTDGAVHGGAGDGGGNLEQG